MADTVFYDAKAQQLRSRVGAVRLIVTTAVPAGGIIQRIYAPNGALLESVPYADAQAMKRQGAALRWFASGEMRGRRTYKAGQLEGQAVVYYSGGTIQQLSLYQQGQEKSRQCFDVSGQLIDCPVETSVGKAYAEYHLGEVMLAREVQRATHYPAVPDGTEPLRGQVVVACAIGVDGKMRETRIYKGMGPAYDREALRVVNGLRGSFSPQLQDGEPVESFYTLGVDFIPPVPR
ncbi:energy transducer TonB [Hymenobacter antarcticus]|uniref:TonB C-terminal domain-containing protein n=1 Tax=Hymenobacter antarcticus TaxID=486270 RepID=A0ABP7P9K8_9BACT